MFSEELSDALQQILRMRELYCETASELCDMSAEYFGDIVRGSTALLLDFFEKTGLDLEETPNELHDYPSEEQLSFRHPRPITAAYCFRLPKHLAIYAVCPRCGHLILQEYDRYCRNCDQSLLWDDFDLVKMRITELT